MPWEASLSRFGVLPDMIPRWYAPMLNQPTSSPMMTRMLGLSAAHAACEIDKPMIAPIKSAIAKGLDLQLTIRMLLLELTFRFFCNGPSLELARYQPTLVVALLHHQIHGLADREVAWLLARWKLSESGNEPADYCLCGNQDKQMLDEPFVVITRLVFRALERIRTKIE